MDNHQPNQRYLCNISSNIIKQEENSTKAMAKSCPADLENTVFALEKTILSKEDSEDSQRNNPDVRKLNDTNIKIKDELANEENTFEKDVTGQYHSYRKSIVFQQDLEDLYADHIFKEEMTIGPEIIENGADLLTQNIYNENNGDTSEKCCKPNKKKKKDGNVCSCGKSFTRQYWFDKHKQSCEFNGLLCHLCGKVCQTKADIKKHMKDHRLTRTTSLAKANQMTIKRKAPFSQSCNICTRKFRLKESLEKHMESHNYNHPQIQESHGCHTCGKKFTLKGNLRLHVKIFHAQTPPAFECDICKKTFKARKYLRDHLVRVHSDSHVKNKNWHTCKYCNKKMYDNLKRHMNYYCVKNPFKKNPSCKQDGNPIVVICDICQKTYRRKHDLRNHILLHMGLQKTLTVKCDICDKKVLRKTLYRHKKEVHKGFCRSSTLGSHKCYVCDICQKKFVRKQSLENHMLHKDMHNK